MHCADFQTHSNQDNLCLGNPFPSKESESEAGTEEAAISNRWPLPGTFTSIFGHDSWHQPWECFAVSSLGWHELRCWAATGQEAERKCHSHLLHQHQSMTPAHSQTVIALIPEVTVDYVSLFCTEHLSPLLCRHHAQPLSFSDKFYWLLYKKYLFSCFSNELKYINSLTYITLPYILHLQWRTLANTKTKSFVPFTFQHEFLSGGLIA